MNTKKSIFSFKENELSNSKMTVLRGGQPINPPPPPVDNTAAQASGSGGGTTNDPKNTILSTTPNN